MKENRSYAGIVLFVIGSVVFLTAGYMYVANNGTEAIEDVIGIGEVSDVGTASSSASNVADTSVDEDRTERDPRLASLVKKDLYGTEVGPEEYGIVDGTSVVDTRLLLPKDGWQDAGFGANGLMIRYPVEGWYVQKNDGSYVVLTTTPSGSFEGGPWAKMTFGEYTRTADQSLFDWMKVPGVHEGAEQPPSDRTTQYVTIGENMFLGSMFFEEHAKAGHQKNVYAEMGPEYVFAASLEVQGMNAGDEPSGEYDRAFYTILESLEVR